jgi:hypothetical protein
MYRRPKPRMDLPEVPFPFLPQEEPELPTFPSYSLDELFAILDASHATCLKTRRSVTGFLIMLCGAAIAYKSKVQPLVATSSTEAEFYSAVFTAKVIKYFRYILLQLRCGQRGPTKMYIDNVAAINMINESRPTPRARHMEIQAFAIIQWRKAGHIVTCHMPGVINSSDTLTKAVPTTLFYRHNHRAMGHCQITVSMGASDPSMVYHPSVEAGESVGANNVQDPSPDSPDGVDGQTDRDTSDVTKFASGTPGVPGDARPRAGLE